MQKKIFLKILCKSSEVNMLNMPNITSITHFFSTLKTFDNNILLKKTCVLWHGSILYFNSQVL